MFFREDGRGNLASHLPSEEMMPREPEPVQGLGPKEQTVARRAHAPAPVGAESGKPASETEYPVIPLIPLSELTLDAFQSQSDPQRKHEMLVVMITELANEEHAKAVRDKLLKTVITILQEIREPSEENAILVQARARSEDPMGKLINALPKAYRATVDVAYINARINADVARIVSVLGGKKKDQRDPSERTTQTTPKPGGVKTVVMKPPVVGEQNIKTPPPLEQGSSAHFE